MALTTRTNGTGTSNLINSDWFNDYLKLLTGVMSDQPITIKANTLLEAIGSAPTTAPSLSLLTGTNLGIGVYRYMVTFTTADGGESLPGPVASITTTTGNQKVSLSSVPLGPTGTYGRKLYRTAAGGSTYKLCIIFYDNGTTTFTDTIADGSLGVSPPTHSTFGGTLTLQDSTGTNNIVFSPDGYMKGNLTATSLSSDGFVNAGGGLGVGGGGIGGGSINTSTSPARLEVLGPSGCYMAFGALGIGPAITKLAEMKANGNFIIAGSQYGTSAGSVSTASGQTFDAFDVAEVYETDQEYNAGTVLCPGANNKLVRCLHDACPFSVVVSPSPGLLLGAILDSEDKAIPNVAAIALTGRVNMKTAYDLSERTFITSDGRGAIRAMQSGEEGYSLGFTLNSTSVIDHIPQVGVFIRPAYVKVP